MPATPGRSDHEVHHGSGGPALLRESWLAPQNIHGGIMGYRLTLVAIIFIYRCVYTGTALGFLGTVLGVTMLSHNVVQPTAATPHCGTTNND